MSAEIDIDVQNLSKVYRIYEKPEHRLIQMATLGRIRRFTEFAALRDISLEVRHGETVGILGRNGSGKSTLLQIICGTLQPTSGSVQVQGRVAALLELGAGFNSEFTGRENVYMNGAILGFSREEMDARFEAIAEFAGIGDFIERPVKIYSTGMFVRLAFAVATAVEPDILVVDEALAVGDEAFQRKCFARIETIKERGGTILFVSHSPQTIVQLCDRAVLLDAGEKLLEGRPMAVVAQYQRLANASAATAQEIRNNIREMSASLDEFVEAAPAEQESDEADVGVAAPAEEIGVAQPEESSPPIPEPDRLDYFDPSLVPQSTVYLEERGARIHDPRILTLNGEAVNVLKMGRRYVFEYYVDFAESAQDLGFGMWVRTKEGFGLAGAQTINSKALRIAEVQAGQQVHVRIEFSCLMVPGSYFITCGVYGSTSEPQMLMHRIVDAVMLQVQPEADLITIGRIDLGITYQIDIA